jgi:hypothetical protein
MGRVFKTPFSSTRPRTFLHLVLLCFLSAAPGAAGGIGWWKWKNPHKPLSAILPESVAKRLGISQYSSLATSGPFSSTKSATKSMKSAYGGLGSYGT